MSNRSFNINDVVSVSVILQEVPDSGSGRSRLLSRQRTDVNLTSWLKRKRSVIDPGLDSVPSYNGLCGPASCLLSVALHRYGNVEMNRLKKNAKELARQSRGLLATVNLMAGPLSLDDLCRVCERNDQFASFDLHVFSIDNVRIAVHRRRDIGTLSIYLLLHDGHYFTLRSPLALSARRHYCHLCGEQHNGPHRYIVFDVVFL